MRRNPIAVQRKREAHGNVQPASLGSRNRYGRRPVAVEKGVDLGQGKLPLKRDAPALVRVLDVDLSKTWRDGIGSLADVRKGSAGGRDLRTWWSTAHHRPRTANVPGLQTSNHCSDKPAPRALQIDPRARPDSDRSPTCVNSTREFRKLPSVEHVGPTSIADVFLSSTHVPAIVYKKRQNFAEAVHLGRCGSVRGRRGNEQKVLAQLALEARCRDTFTRERRATLVGNDCAPIRLSTAGELIQPIRVQDPREYAPAQLALRGRARLDPIRLVKSYKSSYLRRTLDAPIWGVENHRLTLWNGDGPLTMRKSTMRARERARKQTRERTNEQTNEETNVGAGG